MSTHHDGYREVPYPKLRRALALMYRSVQRKHMVHGLIEVDVTEVRRYIEQYRASTGERISFTAFLIACLARAIDENKLLHACHKGTNCLALFEDVDVATAIERDVDGRKYPVIYIVRGANHKTVGQLSQEIRAAQVQALDKVWNVSGAQRWLLRLPMGALRMLWSIFWWIRGRYPRVQKRYGGTVGLTAVGMFGKGGGWGISLPYHTLDVTIGGIAERPVLIDGQVTLHNFLAITLSFDHDVVDGAPATRFVNQLKTSIEQGSGLVELAPDGNTKAVAMSR
jgi:pyruvate/2-oxoglutarate dehydrogenase complex dihydrolipoamide acyltransferase (E2) component